MLKVSYILGFERSGSTLLHDLLALNNDSIGVGESRHICKQYLPKTRFAVVVRNLSDVHFGIRLLTRHGRMVST
jgi:Trk K+ transport system NAD-binding subunit